MRKIVVGALLLAALSAGATYGVTARDGGGETAEQGKQAGGEFGRPKDRPQGPRAGRPSFGPDSTVMERVEIGMAYGEVVALLGPADREETQSTDFGDDVILWYGAWGVYISNKTVRTVDYYGGEA